MVGYGSVDRYIPSYFKLAYVLAMDCSTHWLGLALTGRRLVTSLSMLPGLTPAAFKRSGILNFIHDVSRIDSADNVRRFYSGRLIVYCASASCSGPDYVTHSGVAFQFPARAAMGGNRDRMQHTCRPSEDKSAVPAKFIRRTKAGAQRAPKI